MRLHNAREQFPSVTPSLTLSLKVLLSAATIAGTTFPLPNDMPLQNPALEGYYVVRNFWNLYFNPRERKFTNCGPRGDCHYSHELFVLWAVAVAVQAVVDGARLYPELKQQIPDAIAIFQRYKNDKVKGYCACENNGGDDRDIYYDDDAQVCLAMLSAFEVTGDKRYLDQGRELTLFLMGGWNDDPKAKTKGGMKWHITKPYLNACTTAEVAKCCLQIARHIPNEAKSYIDFAARAIDWQLKVLQDPGDKLIRDGVQADSDKVDDMKWLYNTGTTLSCCSMLFAATGDKHWQDRANELATAATDPNVFFYDRDYPMELRYWRDPSKFNQLLIEGLADYLLLAKPSQEMNERVTNEVARHLKMFYTYSRDERDGLYIESFEPNTTFPWVYDNVYKKQYAGHEKGPGMKGEDHDDHGHVTKSIMGAGLAARVFFQGARVCPQLN